MAHNKIKSQHYNGPQGKRTKKQTQEKGEFLAVSKVPEIVGSLLLNFLVVSMWKRSRIGSEAYWSVRVSDPDSEIWKMNPTFRDKISWKREQDIGKMVAEKEDRRERRHREWEWLKTGKVMVVKC